MTPQPPSKKNVRPSSSVTMVVSFHSAFAVSAMGLRLDAEQTAVDCVRSYPAVDEPTIVSNLEALALDRLHQVKVLGALDLAEHDVADEQGSGIDRDDSAELPRLDLRRHAVAARAEGHGLALPQLRDIAGSPTHLG